MATGGVRGWAAALGPALLIGALLTGCGQPGSTDGSGSTAGPGSTDRSGNAGPTDSPSATATPPEELCTKVVAYWSRKTLDDDTYGDYQSMGLSNGQYEILRKVVDAARAEQKRAGTKAAERLIDRRTRAGCEEWYREGGPSNGPWQ
ncbi:hypothetical protein [Streptomyces capitiformicae]|uniref:hypothetical protein n=1 Tax=Streptomyces capitiformicae TaxID=2014920 RepID=UPI001674E1EC|nr:hypothetical protein [Streptomyces capitiformicae]